MIRINYTFVTVIFQIQATIESAWAAMIPVASRLRLGLENIAQNAAWLAQAISSPTARRKYALLVKFVMQIVEILLLVALALVSSGIDLVAAATAAEGLPDEAQIAEVDEPQAEAGDLPELAELFEQAGQIGSVDHQTVLPDGDLPELLKLFEQAAQIGSATGLPGECSAGDLAAAEMVQPFSTALAVQGNHPAVVQADKLDLANGALDNTPAAVLELTDLAKLGDAELITRAKAAHFPPAKKWAKTRKLGSGEKQRAIAFLLQLS